MSLDTWIELIRSRRQTGPVILPDDAEARLQKLSGIRAVIFDIYGTLFSSGVGDISLATEQDRDAELKSTLTDNNIQLTTGAQDARFDNLLHEHIHTHQAARKEDGIEYPEVEIREVWVDFIQELVADGLIEQDFEADIETLVIDYESRVNPTQAMPELESTLMQLHQRGQVLGIISNAQFYTRLLFDTYLGKDLQELNFDERINVWSYRELEGKPSQALYRLSAAHLKQHHGIEAHEVLYIGNDMRNDIWPANVVGFRTALFAGDTLSLRRREDHPNCAELLADLEITALSQILECI
ncbi:MAG: HAD family hydrolase [Coraliomargarita sp.]